MAALETFANFPSTTVSSGGTTAPSSGTTQTWTVASSAAFPAAATGATQFHVADPALNSEIIAVTNVSGTTWSVTRGAESTTPVAHTAGFAVQQVVTGGALTSLVQRTDLTALTALTGEPVPMNANPSFASGTSPWTGNNGASITTSTVWSYAGGNSLRITPNGTTANPGAQSETTIPVSANTVYTATCMLYCPLGWAGNGEIVINWFTSGNSYISTSVFKPYAIPPGIQIQMLGFALTSPSNAAFASIVPQLLGTPSSSVVFYVDDCALFPGSTINAGQVVRSSGVTSQLSLLQPGDIPGAGEWINAVTQFGAKGDGVTDDTLSIQLALNAAGNGQTVYLPYTFYSYRTSAPLLIPPGVRLLGSRMNVLIRSDYGSTIKPLASWAKGAAAAAAVLLICDQSSGGFASASQEQMVEHINIDGTALVAVADGIQLLGNVPAGRLEKVNVWQVTGTAFNQVVNGSGGPSTWRYTALASNNNGKNGYVVNGSDSTFIDCLSLGDGTSGTFDGWSLAATGNCRFIGCRAEWSTGNGYNLTFTAGYNAALTMTFTGCSTDRNNHDGFHLTGTSSVAVNLTGCFFNRDGRNNSTGGAGYAQIGVTAFQGSLNLAGVSTSCGQNDDGSGTNSAQYGLSVTSMSSHGSVKAAACTFQGNTAATNYDGSAAQYLISPDCVYATGGGSGPTIGTTPLLPVAYGGTNSATRTWAGLLTPTAVKTTTYTAAAGDFVPCDTTGGSFTVTLPTAPADLTVIAAKQVTQGATNTVTIAAGGSDVFNVAAGPVTRTLTLASQAILLQYKSSSAIWYVLADDLPLAGLDSRYVQASALPLGVSSGGTGDASLTAYSVLAGGTTSTGVVQSVSGVGSSGQVLTSNGASTLPTWQAAGGGTALNVVWLPADNGWLAGSCDPATGLGSGFTPTAGTVYLVTIQIRSSITVTKIYWALQNAATGSSTGSFTGLYTSAGAIIASATSADIGANFTSGGGAAGSTPVSCTLGASQSLSGGTAVIAALVLNMTGQPAMFRIGNAVNPAANSGMTNPALRTATYATGSQTSLPSSLGTVNSTGNVPACWLA